MNKVCVLGSINLDLVMNCVGNDESGRELVESLNRDEINTKCIKVDNELPTGIAYIVVDKSGSNFIMICWMVQ